MSRSLRFWCAMAALGLTLPAARAEETVTVEALKSLRLAVEQQGRQIEALTQQIAKLKQTLDGQKPVAPDASAAPPDFGETIEAPKAEPVAKAEPPAGTKHIVVKGETLTSIAKHYNIPLAELQKTNKIEDGRKLQIGQTLTIPNSPAPEPPTEKNP